MKKPTYKEIEAARKVLVDSGIIDAFWCIDDIICRGSELHKPRKITRKQGKEIAQLISRKHDACIGINWDVIDCFIELYFETN